MITFWVHWRSVWLFVWVHMVNISFQYPLLVISIRLFPLSAPCSGIIYQHPLTSVYSLNFISAVSCFLICFVCGLTLLCSNDITQAVRTLTWFSNLHPWFKLESWDLPEEHLIADSKVIKPSPLHLPSAGMCYQFPLTSFSSLRIFFLLYVFFFFYCNLFSNHILHLIWPFLALMTAELKLFELQPDDHDLSMIQDDTN